MDIDSNLANYTVDGILYLDELAKAAGFGDEITAEDNGTIRLRLSPELHFGFTSTMTYIPNCSIEVNYYDEDRYSIELGKDSCDMQVYCQGKTLLLPRSEIRLVVLTLVGEHGSSEDQLIANGFIRIEDAT